jgi:hypothetical protein
MLICRASMLYIFDLVHLFYMIYILVLIWKLPNYLTTSNPFSFDAGYYCESCCSWAYIWYIHNTVVDADIYFIIRPPCYVFQGVDRNFGVWLMAASVIWPQLKSSQKKKKINPEKRTCRLGWCSRRSWQIVIQFSSFLCHPSRWWLINLAPAKVMYQSAQSQRAEILHIITVSTKICKIY